MRWPSSSAWRRSRSCSAALAGLPIEPLQVPAGLLVGLFAPGYLLLRATVGARMKSTLRLILPLPLTLALAALCGVLVEATPNGVNGQATGLALCLCSVVLALVAIRRGTQPVTWTSTDFRPTAAEVLRAHRSGAAGRSRKRRRSVPTSC